MPLPVASNAPSQGVDHRRFSWCNTLLSDVDTQGPCAFFFHAAVVSSVHSLCQYGTNLGEASEIAPAQTAHDLSTEVRFMIRVDGANRSCSPPHRHLFPQPPGFHTKTESPWSSARSTGCRVLVQALSRRRLTSLWPAPLSLPLLMRVMAKPVSTHLMACAASHPAVDTAPPINNPTDDRDG